MKALLKKILIVVVTIAAVLFVEELLDFYNSPINLSDIGFTDE